jgi:hypothetical protein
MRKLLIINTLIIAITSIISYLIYIWFLQKTDITILKSNIQLAFIINTILAVGIMLGMILLRKRIKDQLAFIFMAGSFLKFGCFFIFFYPGFNEDGNVTRNEFFSFFIPYAICLITETATSVRFLNRLDNN